MKTYDLCISPFMRIFPMVLLALFTIGFPLVVFGAEDGPPPILLVPVMGILAWQWWLLLTLAYRIEMLEDGALEWVALGRRVRTLPEEIQEIGPDRTGNVGFFRVRHSGGTVRFLNQITGFHEVLAHVKGRNPRVVLRGC